MGKTIDKHKKQIHTVQASVKSLRAEASLTAKEVLERNEKCKADKVCYVSLRPLTDENVFTLTTKEGQFSMLKKYGEQAVELYK